MKPDLTPASIKNAATCHPDKPAVAKGLCRACYRAADRAKKRADALEHSKKSDESNAATLSLEWDKDPALKAEMGAIMWKWMREAEVEAIYVTKDGRKERDYQTELRLGELRQKRAEKAASILAKAYVTEKIEEIKPRPLPIGDAVDMSGWGSDAPSAVEYVKNLVDEVEDDGEE